MSEDERKNAKTLFAVAVARGASASSWGRANNISLQTVQRWSKEPAVDGSFNSSTTGKWAKRSAQESESVVPSPDAW